MKIVGSHNKIFLRAMRRNLVWYIIMMGGIVVMGIEMYRISCAQVRKLVHDYMMQAVVFSVQWPAADGIEKACREAYDACCQASIGLFPDQNAIIESIRSVVPTAVTVTINRSYCSDSIFVECVRPWCLINHDRVMGANTPRLYPASLFNPVLLRGLPSVIFSQELIVDGVLDEDAARWCYALTHAEMSAYHFEYRNACSIVCSPLRNQFEGRMVMTDYGCTSTDRSLLYDRVGRLSEKLISNRSTMTAKKGAAYGGDKLLFDVRFKNRVYVKKCKTV